MGVGGGWGVRCAICRRGVGVGVVFCRVFLGVVGFGLGFGLVAVVADGLEVCGVCGSALADWGGVVDLCGGCGAGGAVDLAGVVVSGEDVVAEGFWCALGAVGLV